MTTREIAPDETGPWRAQGFRDRVHNCLRLAWGAWITVLCPAATSSRAIVWELSASNDLLRTRFRQKIVDEIRLAIRGTVSSEVADPQQIVQQFLSQQRFFFRPG
jgi:hypothetical protein